MENKKLEEEIISIIEHQFEKILSKKIEDIITVKFGELTDTITNHVLEETKVIIQDISDVDMESKEKIINHLENVYDGGNTELASSINKLPEKLKIKDVEKYMVEKGIKSFTKRRFLYFIEQEIIPSPIEKYKNQATYTKEHVLRYLIVDKVFDQLGMERTKRFIQIIEPLIIKEGLFDTADMLQLFEDIINGETMNVLINVISNGILQEPSFDNDVPKEYQEYYANIMALSVLNFMSKQYVNSFDLLTESYQLGGAKRIALDKAVELFINKGVEDGESRNG